MFTILQVLAAVAMSTLNPVDTSVACWAKAADDSHVVISCGVAVDGQVIGGMNSPPLEHDGSVDAKDLAGAYCALIAAAMVPPVHQEASASPWIHN